MFKSETCSHKWGCVYHEHEKLQEHELNQGHNKENKSQEMQG
jgi:hypothetical protein